MKVHITTVEEYEHFTIVAAFDDEHAHLAHDLASTMENSRVHTLGTQESIDEFKITQVHMPREGPPTKVEPKTTQYSPYPMLGFEGFTHNLTMLFSIEGHDETQAVQSATTARDTLVSNGIWPTGPHESAAQVHLQAAKLLNTQKENPQETENSHGDDNCP